MLLHFRLQHIHNIFHSTYFKLGKKTTTFTFRNAFIPPFTSRLFPEFLIYFGNIVLLWQMVILKYLLSAFVSEHLSSLSSLFLRF